MTANHNKHFLQGLLIFPMILILVLSMGNFSSALCKNDALPEPPEDKNIAGETASDESANAASSAELLNADNTVCEAEYCEAEYCETIYIGDNASTITVNYTYSYNDGSRCIDQITGIAAAKSQGWCYVSPDVSCDFDQITFTNNGAKAVIPFTYYASIGSGLMPWDDLIVIDLYQLAPNSAENCI